MSDTMPISEDQKSISIPVPIPRPKLGFASEVKRIELEGGTWVDYKMPPYDEYVRFITAVNEKKDKDLASASLANLELLQKCLVAWSDESVPCTQENIANLGTEVIIYLSGALIASLSPEKKS